MAVSFINFGAKHDISEILEEGKKLTEDLIKETEDTQELERLAKNIDFINSRL